MAGQKTIKGVNPSSFPVLALFPSRQTRKEKWGLSEVVFCLDLDPGRGPALPSFCGVSHPSPWPQSTHQISAVDVATGPSSGSAQVNRKLVGVNVLQQRLLVVTWNPKRANLTKTPNHKGDIGEEMMRPHLSQVINALENVAPSRIIKFSDKYKHATRRTKLP